jgi:hypothetical protein
LPIIESSGACARSSVTCLVGFFFFTEFTITQNGVVPDNMPRKECHTVVFCLASRWYTDVYDVKNVDDKTY